MKRFIQIMPCQGKWNAVYAIEGEPVFKPMLGWAIFEEDDGERTVEGLDADDFVDSAEECANFIGYAAPDDAVENWTEGAVRYQKCEDEKRERRLRGRNE